MWLPVMYHYYMFMLYGLEQHDCFQMPTLRLQHWVFSTQDIFMICAGYIYVQFAASLINSLCICCVSCRVHVCGGSCSFLVLYIRCLFYSIGIYDSPLLCQGKNACLSGIEQLLFSDAHSCCQYIVGRCGMLFSDCPCILFFAALKDNQLRLPSLYAMLILLLMLFYLSPLHEYVNSCAI